MEQCSSHRCDADLVRATLGGDRGAFAGLVRRYERAVRATSLAVLKDSHLAEDSAQETFVRAYSELRRLKDPAAFGGWLLGIGRRTALSHLRMRRSPQPLHMANIVSAPAEPPKMDERDRLVLAAVTRLPDSEQIAVYLRYFESMDVTEVARATGRPVGTITKQLSRAHRRLRGWLRKETL